MPKQPPLRTCLGSNETLPKAALWRFVAGPDDKVWFDGTGKAPGRGAYTQPAASFLAQAIKRKAFSRKLAANPPADLIFQVQQRLTEQLLGQLGLLMKAGRLVSGREKVLEQADLQAENVILLAHDSGQETRSLVQDLGRGLIWTGLDKAQLEQVTGRPNIPVVAATAAPKITELVRQLQTFDEIEGAVT